MQLRTNQATVALNSAALAQTLTVENENMLLLAVMLHAVTAISQTVTVTLNSVFGLTTYTYLLDTATLSSATNYVFRPNPGIPLRRGDTIVVACTNSGTPSIVVYSEIRYCDAS